MPHNISLRLPYDLELEILSRLPIESIIRFRSVCKSWKNITQDPHFISLQLRKSNTQPSRFLITTEAIQDSYASCFLFDMTEAKTKILFNCVLDNPDFMCSYHGLICIAPHFYLNPLIICNPITREYLILPMSNFRGVVLFHRVSLGYDDSTKRYKVVRSYKTGVDCPSRIELLILGESFWKELPTTVSFFDEKHGPVFCNGAFYWIAGQFNHYHLLMLDISSEKFLITAEICFLETFVDKFTSLLNLEGSLIFAFHHSKTLNSGMLRLTGNEAGKAYVMQLPEVLRGNGASHVNVELISMLRQGGYMLEVSALRSYSLNWNKVLVNYHPETGAVIFYDMNIFPQDFNVMKFKPSLVSPHMVASSNTT